MRAAAPPPNTADTGRMRALAQPMQPIPPMPVAPAPRDLPAWTPEPLGMQEDEFAELAAQARLGVRQGAVDEAARRKKQRLFMACGVAVVVAGALVFAIEKLYDPEARAREAAIAQSMQQMAEQQKATDNLTLIEVGIEDAIMNNDLDTARSELAKLVELKPDHPRREFLQASIDRAAALARLTPQNTPAPATEPQSPTQAAVVPPAGSSRNAAHRTITAERDAGRATPAPAPRPVEPARAARNVPQAGSRAYGAPIGEAPPSPTIPLDAPINAPPTTAARRTDNAFVGRTLEASDAASMTRVPVAAPAAAVGAAASPSMSGANLATPPATAPAPAPPPAATRSQSGAAAVVDVVPAKIIKRIAPIAPPGVPRKTAGQVVVKYTISDNGRVTDIEVVESTPAGVFDDAAESAVRKWVYEPRRENGVAVESQARARIVFEAAD
jgi:protein TonB